MHKLTSQNGVPRYSRMVEESFSVPIPRNTSHVNHSFCSSVASERISEGYSIKYVHSGRECYEVNGRKHKVNAGNFLVVSNGSKCKFIVEERQVVEGVCIYLSSGQMAQVWHSLHQSDKHMLDSPEVDTSGEVPALYENVFNLKYAGQLNQLVQEVRTTIKAPDFMESELHEELFYSLAEKLCLHQQKTQMQLHKIEARKKTTREELYRRLLISRDYLQDNLTEQLNLEKLADAASLSEFHFLRQFKAAFGKSPYQYLLQLRLQLAKQLLQKEGLTVADVAQACGFKEVQAFSKLFRKHTGQAPTLFLQSF